MRRTAAAVVAVSLVALTGCSEEAAPRKPRPVPTPPPATLFVSPTGDDTANCKQATPCQSFERVYTVAPPGAIVDVATGDYGEQTIPAVPARRGPPVELRAAQDAQVHVDDLAIAGDKAVIRGMTIPGVGVTGDRRVSDVSLIDITGRRLWINNVRNVTVSGGSYGDVTDESPVRIGSSPSSHDVTFDGVLFHDARARDPKAHMECLLALDVQGLTIRGSRFTGCGIFGLLVGHLFGKSPRDVRIEGNVFEPTHQPSGEQAPYSMMIGELDGPAERFVVRDNTFLTDPALLPESFVDSEISGNTGPGAAALRQDGA